MDNNIYLIEECYKKFISDINYWIPEGVVDVNLNILHDYDLLHYHTNSKVDHSLTRYFHVIESSEKITLINDQFIIWIVPEKILDTPITYTLIALNQSDLPQLEMAFSTTGVYNSSKLVLRVLEKFLIEIQENEDLIASLKKVS